MAINLNIVLNKSKGAFTGVFDLSEAINNYYDDYLDTETPVTLSIGANPVRGSLSTVRVIGGSLNTIPSTWNFSGDSVSTDIAFLNEITIFYVSSEDIRIVNRLVDAPDITAPTFAVAPTATNIQETSFDITATLNENGTVYGYLLADGSPAPDTDTVIANAQQSFVDSGSGGTLSFTGLTVDTNYDVYVVAEDTVANKQASPILVEVLTAGAISAETQSIINNMPNPLQQNEITAIGQFVDNIDYSTVFEVQAYNLLNSANALQGWKNVANPINNGTVHVSGSGFVQQGGSDYINSNIIPSTIGFTQGNQAIHIYIRTSSDLVDLASPYGGQNGTTYYTSYYRTTNALNYGVGDDPSNDIISPFTYENSSVYSFIRQDASNISVYKDGILLQSDAEIALPLLNIPLYVLGFNQNGTPNFFYQNGSIGGIMVSNNTEINNRAVRFKTFMDSLL